MKHFIIALLTLVFALSSDPAFASLTQTQVSQLYIGVFGRASEGGGNSYWQSDPQSTSMTATANVMLNTDPAKAYFGDTMNDNAAFVAHIYSYTLGKSYADDPTGQNYWVSELVAGKSKGEMIAALISSAQHPDNAGEAQDRFNNKVEVSNYCADNIFEYTDLETFVGFISSVTDSSSTVASAMRAIDSMRQSIEENNTTGTEVDLSSGGTITLENGVVLRVLEGSGTGTVSVKAQVSGSSGDEITGSLVISRSYDLISNDLQRGDSTVPILVSLPVDSSLIPADADPYSFDVQVYNTATGEWDWVDGWAFYDPEDGDVSFYTGHFSRYRVLHSEPSDRGDYDHYRVSSRSFNVYYYEPTVFGMEAYYSPPTDAAWAPLGGGFDDFPDIWNYVEDLDETLEDSLAYYLEMQTSAGGKLFADPITELEPTPLDCYVTYIPKKIAGGDSKFGIMRISASLDDYQDMRRVAAHELVHVLCDQHYTVAGAAYNRWFFEAIADLWTSRALGMTRAEQITFFSRTKYNYLKVSLDASDEGSYYAAADFLYWLERETGRSLAADVVAADYTNDLTGLSNLVAEGGSLLSDYYIKYVLQASVGDHDLSVPLVENATVLTDMATGTQEEIKLRHLSAKGINIRSDLAVDGMLVVSSDRSAKSEEIVDLQTFSYAGFGLPVQDIDAYLENEYTDEPIVIKHFGKKGTSGVTESDFYQIVINYTQNLVDRPAYQFEAYLLVPPLMQVSERRVDIAYTAQYSAGISSELGFNVYADGEKLNTNLLPLETNVFEDNRIHVGADVLVSIVDKYNNEWPEVQTNIDTTTGWRLISIGGDPNNPFLPTPTFKGETFLITSGQNDSFKSWIYPANEMNLTSDLTYTFDANSTPGKVETLINWTDRVYPQSGGLDVSMKLSMIREWLPKPFPQILKPGQIIEITETVSAKIEPDPSTLPSALQFTPKVLGLMKTSVNGQRLTSGGTDSGIYTNIDIEDDSKSLLTRKIPWTVPDGTTGETMVISFVAFDSGSAGLGYSSGYYLDNFQSAGVSLLYQYR